MRVAVAAVLLLGAATKLSSVIPGTGVLVILALVTVPSGSVALTLADVAVPCDVLREAGQLSVMDWFTTGHGFVADAEFRGVGLPVEKSTELLSLSVQPLPARLADVVFVSTDAGDVSEQFAAPYPIKSTTVAPNGHPVPVKAVVLFTKATLPAVADMAMLPVASGVGRLVVPPAPAAS